MPFNLGPAELILVMAVALIVFGPKKLPEIGKGIGNALREFNKARNDFMDSLDTETDRPEPAYSSAASLPADSYGTTAQSVAQPANGHREYTESVQAESADALPYGGDFYAVEGDSQPSFRTAEPDTTPATVAANSTAAREGEGKA